MKVLGVKRSRPRPYEGRGRQEQARATRERILAIARVMFLEKGYGVTTIAAVAERAQVSVETIYKGFGGKAGLVRAIHTRGLEGAGPSPAERRSDAMSASEEDPRALLDSWGVLTAEVAPRVAPIYLLLRSAAAADTELSSLLRQIDEGRLSRMKKNARVLAKRRFLRQGMSVEEAAEIMWAYTAPDFYDLLVVRQGWTPEALGQFVAEALKAALLRP